MSFSPHTHKYFGVLIAVIVLAVLVLGVRVGKLSELSATVSLQRGTSVGKANVTPHYGTTDQFLSVLKQNNQPTTPRKISDIFKPGKLPKPTTAKKK